MLRTTETVADIQHNAILHSYFTLMCNLINNHQDESTANEIEEHLNSTTLTMTVIQWLISINGYTRELIGVKKAMLLSYTVK